MRIQSLLLCDSASVREGLVSMLSAGATRVFDEAGGSPTLVIVAVVAVAADEFGRENAVRVAITAPEGRPGSAEIAGSVQVELEGGAADETTTLPQYVPLLFHVSTEALRASLGIHHVTVFTDEDERRIEFFVGPRPPTNSTSTVRIGMVAQPRP